MLSPEQIAHFETFGFLVLRLLFSHEEIAIMKRESVEIFDEEAGLQAVRRPRVRGDTAVPGTQAIPIATGGR